MSLITVLFFILFCFAFIVNSIISIFAIETKFTTGKKPEWFSFLYTYVFEKKSIK